MEPDEIVQHLGKCGFVGELELPPRCGAKRWAFQIVYTVKTANPATLAMARVG